MYPSRQTQRATVWVLGPSAGNLASRCISARRNTHWAAMADSSTTNGHSAAKQHFPCDANRDEYQKATGHALKERRACPSHSRPSAVRRTWLAITNGMMCSASRRYQGVDEYRSCRSPRTSSRAAGGTSHPTMRSTSAGGPASIAYPRPAPRRRTSVWPWPLTPAARDAPPPPNDSAASRVRHEPAPDPTTPS